MRATSNITHQEARLLRTAYMHKENPLCLEALLNADERTVGMKVEVIALWKAGLLQSESPPLPCHDQTITITPAGIDALNKYNDEMHEAFATWYGMPRTTLPEAPLWLKPATQMERDRELEALYRLYRDKPINMPHPGMGIPVFTQPPLYGPFSVYQREGPRVTTEPEVPPPIHRTGKYTTEGGLEMDDDPTPTADPKGNVWRHHPTNCTCDARHNHICDECRAYTVRWCELKHGDDNNIAPGAGA